MWIFSETGFVSAVTHRSNPTQLVVRGRDRRSLEPLAERTGAAIIDGEGTDYRFRVVVDRGAFRAWVDELIDGIAYPNFKSQAARTRGARFAHALSDVWSTMFDFGRGEPDETHPRG